MVEFWFAVLTVVAIIMGIILVILWFYFVVLGRGRRSAGGYRTYQTPDTDRDYNFPPLVTAFDDNPEPDYENDVYVHLTDAGYKMVGFPSIRTKQSLIQYKESATIVTSTSTHKTWRLYPGHIKYIK